MATAAVRCHSKTEVPIVSCIVVTDTSTRLIATSHGVNRANKEGLRAHRRLPPPPEALWGYKQALKPVLEFI